MYPGSNARGKGKDPGNNHDNDDDHNSTFLKREVSNYLVTKRLLRSENIIDKKIGKHKKQTTKANNENKVKSTK